MPASKPSAREGDPARAWHTKCLAQLSSENCSLALQEPLHCWFIIRNCSALLTYGAAHLLRSKRDSDSLTSLLPLSHTAARAQPGLSQPGLSALLSLLLSLWNIFVLLQSLGAVPLRSTFNRLTFLHKILPFVTTFK